MKNTLYVEFPCPICNMETDWADGNICSNCLENARDCGYVPTVDAHTIIAHAKHKYGWIGKNDLEIIATNMETRLTQCLVRCGGCRFLAAAQDVKFLIESVEKNGDYVRDVSIK